jgi:ketosteroid isomerase-like protein
MNASLTRAAAIGAAIATAGCVVAALAAFAPASPPVRAGDTPRASVSHVAPAPESMRAGIDAALAHSVAGWNSGNLGRFMALYLDDNRTTYAATPAYLHGRAAISAYYASSFKPGAQRDSLRLEHIEVDSLTPAIAEVMGFYVLSRGDSTTGHGPTSLVMQRVQGTWYVVHDHSN